jgi:hypothetical protein
MTMFVVKTHESVAGTYLVEAENAAEARAKFEQPRHLIDWDDFDQTDYMAFALEVQSVEPDTP